MKDNKQPTAAPTSGDTSPYFQLHTQAVEDLVTASKENTPEYSKEELEKYRSSKGKFKLPEWLKVLLIKFWFHGAICFFVFWGLGLYVADQLDMYFIAAIITGMVTDLLLRHFLRFTETLPGGANRWMMVAQKSTMGFFLNLMYGFVIIFLVVTAYTLINMGLQAVFGGENPPFLGVEPLMYGLLCTGADQLCIAIKHLCQSILRDAKAKENHPG